MTTVTNIPCAQIVPGDNHRKTFDQAKLNELAASIEASGLAQPITIRPVVICPYCKAIKVPKTQGEIDLWKSIVDPKNQLSLTPPESWTEKDVSFFHEKDETPFVSSLSKAAKTTENIYVDGSKNNGASGASLESNEGITWSNTMLFGAGPSGQDVMFCGCWNVSSLTSSSNKKKLKKQSEKSKNELIKRNAGQHGVNLRTNTLNKTTTNSQTKNLENTLTAPQTPSLTGLENLKSLDKVDTGGEVTTPFRVNGQKKKMTSCESTTVKPLSQTSPMSLVEPSTVSKPERVALNSREKEENTAPWFGFEIVAGERRYRATSEILRWDTIPSIIKWMNDETADRVMLAENTGRADLNPIEEANAYHRHMQKFDTTEEEVAQVAGKSADLVKRRISLRKLNEEIRDLVATGHFPLGHAEAITELDPNRQRIAVRVYRESKNGLPLAAFRSIVSQLLEEQSQDSLFDLEQFWVNQVQELADLPRRGKRAVTGAPTRNDLPPVQIGTRETQGGIIDRYIADLLQTGHAAEAAAIGNLYDAMVKTNYLAVPANAILLKNGQESP